MVPKLHAKGTSFKGAAAYLLHDKDASTDERVAWTETRNLAVESPDLAWRIMAATAMDQDRLKENAGVKATGRKSDKHVLHLTLAWHPEQTPDRDEMTRAADGALAAIGASDRQTLIIAHDDEAHPHLHIVVNRVSPEDGRHLSSSNEKRNLSQWAEAYEKETGQIYCEARIVNNAMRTQGDYVRGDKDAPRHLFEQARAAVANDNSYAEGMRAGQKAKDAEIAKAGREMDARHKADWKALQERHKARRTSIRKQAAQDLARASRAAAEAYRPKLAAMLRRQRAELKTFEALEGSLFGRMKNRIDTASLLHQVRGETPGTLISRGFRVLSNAGARREAFEASQVRARNDLHREQKAEVAAKRASIKADQQGKLKALRESFVAERASMVLSQDMDRAKLRASWMQRGKDRAEAWEKFAAFDARRRQVRGGFREAVSPARSESDTGYRASLLARHARMAMRGNAETTKPATNKDRGDRER